MKFVGYVSCEGGPLIIGDASIVRTWRGYVNDDVADDYKRVCAVFDNDPQYEGGPIEVGSGQVVTWEMQGAGTSFVYEAPGDGLIIVRPWVDDPDADDSVIEEAAQLPLTNRVALGDLEVATGAILIMWATMSGLSFSDAELAVTGEPIGDLSMGETALVVTTPHKHFHLIHDYVEGPFGQARRCHLQVAHE